MGFLYFIIGVVIGFTLMAFISGASINDELSEAYEKGRADERARIIEEVNEKFGVSEKKEDNDAEV